MKSGVTPAVEEHDVSSLTSSGTLRQSPPPKTDETQVPPGAVISPPDSAANSSDDDEPGARGRKLDVDNLAELQAAIRVIEQHREGSPSRNLEEVEKAQEAIAAVASTSHSAAVQLKVEEAKALSQDMRRQISHQRANTETIFLDLRQSPECSISPSDEDSISDEEGSHRLRPPMVRKKSGELVRPALRPSSGKRRPSSMPGTPTFGKAVHFDSHLEHVRHFLQVDRPLAVSAGSSPIEPSYEGDDEFPFHDEPRGPPFEWELVLANFPPETPLRRAQPVRVERVYLSSDNKNMVGSVAVANMAFNKFVVARFTLDYWKTTSEVVAEYHNDVRQPRRADGSDRFNFTIKLADLANLEAKTMFFCVRYSVNGQEYWDNNGSTNFQVDFRKKALPQHGKRGMQPASARSAGPLPRSHPRKAPSPSPTRPPAMPTALDDFTDGFDLKDFKQPVNRLLGEPDGAPTLRLKGVKSATNIPASHNQHPAFGTRYDFNTSLSTAIKNANSTLGDRSGITMKPRPAPMRQPAKYDPEDGSTLPPHQKDSPARASKANPVRLPAPGLAPISGAPQDGADKPCLSSQSYNELIDKYCFVRTHRSSRA